MCFSMRFVDLREQKRMVHFLLLICFKCTVKMEFQYVLERKKTDTENV